MASWLLYYDKIPIYPMFYLLKGDYILPVRLLCFQGHASRLVGCCTDQSKDAISVPGVFAGCYGFAAAARK